MTAGTPSSLGPSLPARLQPAGCSRSPNQIEDCSSSLTTTLHVLLVSPAIVILQCAIKASRKSVLPPWPEQQPCQ